jgi:hypothetical protein
MTWYPVLPPLLLVLVAAVVVAGRVVSLQRLRAAPRRAPKAVWRWAGVTAAAVLLLVAAARPVIGADAQTAPAGSADGEPNVFLVVDRSPEMGVEDMVGPQSRMDAARADIAAIIDRYPRARFGVIAFASTPDLEWPLSPDTWSLRPVMAAVRPYAAAPDAVYETNVAAAGNVLRYQLISARQQFPRADNLVFYLGSGAGESRAPQRQFDLTEGSVDGGAVLGYGTAEGGVVPQDPSVRSSVDEQALRAAADQIGVPFVLRDGRPDREAALFEDTDEPSEAPDAVTASSAAVETYWAPAIIAAALILLELGLMLRDYRRSRPPPVDVVT